MNPDTIGLIRAYLAIPAVWLLKYGGFVNLI